MLAFQSVQRLIFPEPLVGLDIGLWVIVASLLVAVGLVAMQTWVVRKTGSIAIAADRAHYLTDVAVNGAVLLALAVTKWTNWTRADPAFALAISGYMLWNAWAIAKEAVVQLLDHELPIGERQRIRDTILACEGACNIHDLRTRFSGDRIFVEYHLEVDGALTVRRAHAIGDATEVAVENDERLDERVNRRTTAHT